MLLSGLLYRFDKDLSIVCGLLAVEGLFGDLLDLALRLQDVLCCGSFALVSTHGYFLKKIKVIIIILVVQGLEVNFDYMVFVIVVVGVRLCHCLFDQIIVLIKVHADTSLGPPQERWSEKFLLSHRFSIRA